MYGIDEKARTWAQIDLGAMKHNLDIAKRTGVKVMCVIKANAYGHGAVVCGRFLQENGADAFAVACLSEAVELRENGKRCLCWCSGIHRASMRKRLQSCT